MTLVRSLKASLAALLFASNAALLSQTVQIVDGDAYVTVGDSPHRLTSDGGNLEAKLSPDGRQVALIHSDHAHFKESEEASTSVWLVDLASGGTRRLLDSKPDQDPSRNLTGFGAPTWSLDGGYVYVNADAWATSPAVHQVSVANGKERFVIDGWIKAVVRTGPYRGYLLVGRHKYSRTPGQAAFNPVYVVRPDGREQFVVAGSEHDEGERSVPTWLSANGWQAW